MPLPYCNLSSLQDLRRSVLEKDNALKLKSQQLKPEKLLISLSCLLLIPVSLFSPLYIKAPIITAIIMAKKKASRLRQKVIFLPSSFISSGMVTKPTMVKVVKNAAIVV